MSSTRSLPWQLDPNSPHTVIDTSCEFQQLSHNEGRFTLIVYHFDSRSPGRSKTYRTDIVCEVTRQDHALRSSWVGRGLLSTQVIACSDLQDADGGMGSPIPVDVVTDGYTVQLSLSIAVLQINSDQLAKVPTTIVPTVYVPSEQVIKPMRGGRNRRRKRTGYHNRCVQCGVPPIQKEEGTSSVNSNGQDTTVGPIDGSDDEIYW